jgi:hypothetical protein
MSFISPFTGNVIQPTDVSYRTVTLSANTTLEWPINGNATPNYVARIMNVTATTSSLTLRLPPANQASVGEDVLVRNVGAETFTLADYDGNTIVSMAAGLARYVYITSNATTAGTWSVLAFGAGASAIDASSLAGNGLKAISSTLNSAINVTTFSSSYTALDTDRAKNYVWTGGTGTLTLPAATSIANNWFIAVRNGGTGTLTVNPTGGDLINGSAALSLQPNDSCFITCSGFAFYTVGLGKSTLFNFTQLTKAVTSGSYTLTSAEASNVIQKYTGTLSSNVTIELPATIQVYYITNQTDGTGAGYQLTFTTGLPGANTANVPPGEQVILLCDSANVFNASTIAAGAVTLSLPNGLVSSPPLNFASEMTSGMYRPGSGEIAFSILGTQRLLIEAVGITVNGTGVFSGGVNGGTF